MSNIRVDVNYTIKDGSEIVFRSPADCSAITGLIVYYPTEAGDATSTVFALADAHANNLGDIDYLFAENAVVKVILDVTAAMAYVQNADTNAYIESTFIKTINSVGPDANGNVQVEVEKPSRFWLYAMAIGDQYDWRVDYSYLHEWQIECNGFPRLGDVIMDIAGSLHIVASVTGSGASSVCRANYLGTITPGAAASV